METMIGPSITARAVDAPAQLDVTAIVVNWNTRDLLAETLTSLEAHAGGFSMEVIVVDNGSVDDSVEMVRRDWPSVRLIVNEENVGFTRANNQAIRVSHGKYLLLINSDALLTPGCLDRMIARMEQDVRVGAVGPRLVYGDGSWQRWTAGRAPSLSAALYHYLFLDRILPGDPARGLYLGRDVRNARVTDWVCSACMLVRRSALDEVGLLDENLFVYMDDVDLCQRLRDGGWSVWYCPEAEAIHYGSQSTERVVTTTSTVALRAFNRYFARRHGPAAAIALKGIQALGFGLRALAYRSMATVRRGDPRLRSMASAHWTYCKVAAEPRIQA
jgi:N-acetylglucosaminyl-diphospho-decaprenol L-rhamnosyltransferase